MFRGYNYGDEGEITSTYTSAYNAVKYMKKQWGTGISTLIIVMNKTGEILDFTNSSHTCGRFETKPRDIPIRKVLAFLDVKRTSTWYGSIGSATF